MNIIFKLSALLTLLFVLPGMATQVKSESLRFDKAAFYAAMAGNKIEEVDAVLSNLEESTLAEKMAYEGALLMKKAGLAKKAKDKLSLFKSGRIKLEEALKNDGDNIEYHFLRLIIQENAPRIVKYKNNLINDAALLRTSFKKLSPVVQQAVRGYAKKSKILNPADF